MGLSWEKASSVLHNTWGCAKLGISHGPRPSLSFHVPQRRSLRFHSGWGRPGPWREGANMLVVSAQLFD